MLQVDTRRVTDKDNTNKQRMMKILGFLSVVPVTVGIKFY